MTWYQANDWIASLNSSNYLGYNDWRLPVTLPINGTSYNYSLSCNGSTDVGYNITSPNSEMAYMYYVELGNQGEYDLNGNTQCIPPCLTQIGPFINLQANHYYSGTENALDPTDAWGINFGHGGQFNTYDKIYGTSFAWAVRTVVPEPISSILFVTGGTLLAGRRFLKRRKIAQHYAKL